MNPLQPPKVSILVPIFRVEQYLPQCVDSLIAQTLTDIEIILIDDGSDDACPQICDAYASRDPRVKVIHKANSGYGASMNQGLKLASGDYIGIVEPDDRVEPEMFEELHALAEEHGVNVVRSNFFRYTDETGDELVAHLPQNDLERVMNPLQQTGVFYCQPTIWACLYKRRFLEESHIDFLESPGASYQDVGFNFKVWLMAEHVWLTPQAYYHYRCDHLGASVKSQGKVFCIVDEWREIERYLEQYPELRDASYMLRNVVKLSNYRWNLERLSGEAYQSFLAAFSQEFREILRNGGLTRDYISANGWNELMKIVYANSWRCHLCFWKNKLVRLLIKYKMREGKRKYSVLCGLVRFERDIPHIWQAVPAKTP